MTQLEIIVTEAVKRGIPVAMRYSHETSSIEYVVEGFSKSGTATLKQKGDVVSAHTRYNQIDIIESFEDLAQLAFNWYLDYSGREPFTSPSAYWAETFVAYGWLKKETSIVVTYK